VSERERVLALRQDLGRQLRGLRKEADLSQQQLASRIGYTRSAVSNTESGGYAARRFWRKCDELFGTDGVLARRYDQIHLQTATHRHPAGNTQRIPPDGNAGLRRLRATGGSGALGEALAAYRELGWPVEQRQDRLVLVTGTVVDALEIPRSAGRLAARWWTYTSGAADAVRGLPALPHPEQALAVISAGDSCYFLAASGSSPWTEPDVPVDRPIAEGGPTIRWHCLGSGIPAPPAPIGEGNPASWACLPSRRLRLAPAIGLLDLLAIATSQQEADRLRLPGGVSAIPVPGYRLPLADDTVGTI